MQPQIHDPLRESGAQCAVQAPVLQALEAKQERLRASLDGARNALIEGQEAEATTELEKRTWGIAMWCCISDDIRQALGIAPPAFPSKAFLFQFVQWCQVVEKNIGTEPQA